MPLREPGVKQDGRNMKVNQKIVYLVVTIDGMLWVEHIKQERLKTTEVANKLMAIAGRV